MKISVKEKMKEAEQISLRHPEMLYRVMDKKGDVRLLQVVNEFIEKE